MAALSTNNPTLLDLAKRTDPDGKIAAVVEILNETNEILDDMVWQEGNLPTGHRTTIRSGLPAPTWRKLYEGVQPNKSTTVQVTDNCGMLEARSSVDKALVELNGNTAAFRASEDRAHIEGMGQELADTVFYGNDGSEPEAFTGLAPRFNSLSAANAENILVGGGAGNDNGSVWLVTWGPNTCHGIIPKGSKAGLQVDDLGIGDELDANGKPYRAYKSHYRWDCGLCVRDWRYIVRVPNIDKSALSVTWTSGAFSSGADLSDLMAQAIDRVPNISMGRAAFYMSRTMKGFLRRQVSAKTQGSTLTTENVGGVIIDRFQGIPIRRCDALAADEALVS